MLKKLGFLFSLIVIATMCSCSDDNGDVSDVVSDSASVLVYIVADNSLSSRVDEDIDEMLKGMEAIDNKKCYSNNNLLVYVDGLDLPVLYSIQKNKSGVAQKIVEKSYSQEKTSTSVETIKEVIKDAFGKYPADSYGFVYWSHGDGWLPSKLRMQKSVDPTLRWIGQDGDNYSGKYSYTDIEDLVNAFSVLPKKLDFLMFDACFMLDISVAYDLRGLTDYIIASPTEIPGPGAPYDIVVPYMFSRTATPVDIGKAYFSYYNEKYDNNVSNQSYVWTGGVSIGVTKTASLDNLAQITKTSIANPESSVTDLVSGVLDYDRRFVNHGHIGYYDMKSLMSKLIPNSANYQLWQEAYESSVVYWETTPTNYSSYVGSFSMDGSNGFSHYVPQEDNARNAAYRTTGWYNAAGLSALGW